jgi:ATP-binding cassette, subfamily C, bacterial CydC
MKALWIIFAMILRTQRRAVLRGALLGLIVLAMGVALLGLSGWFITAAAAAGLAGTGAVFDVFRPSAMVRFLALGRAAARYGERLLTHDATLRALETLRVTLLAGLMVAPHAKMIRIRGAQALNRLTSDIDALDGVPLRLVLPLIAGVGANLVAFIAIWLLVDLRIALWIGLANSLGATALFWATARESAPLSRQAEAASQAFRSRLIDLIRGRRDLAVLGQISVQKTAIMAADERKLSLRRRQDRQGRRVGAASAMLSTTIAGGTLWLGVAMAQAGQIAPAFAALAFFATLALAETIVPLRRAASDLGRMLEAARRVSRDISIPPDPPQAGEVTDGPLRIEALALHRPYSEAVFIKDLSFQVAAGETVALTGASGVGKSSVLLAIAGLHPVTAGQISFGGRAVTDWPEDALRASVTLLAQRSVLMAGTVAEALRLADPSASDATLRAVIEAVQLTRILAARGGLDARIGIKGEGFSGGEARRLTLARVLLRRPKLLLLDEPTEGLDENTAKAVLDGIRTFLPTATIVLASHRDVETRFAARIITLYNSH